jgi:flagellar protein FlaG
MGQNSVSSVIPAAAPVQTVPVGPSKETRALTREASAAVQQLNDANYAGDGREVTFSVDRASRRPVIKVVDTTTKEVIQQWPLEYILQLAAQTKSQERDSR